MSIKIRFDGIKKSEYPVRRNRSGNLFRLSPLPLPDAFGQEVFYLAVE